MATRGLVKGGLVWTTPWQPHLFTKEAPSGAKSSRAAEGCQGRDYQTAHVESRGTMFLPNHGGNWAQMPGTEVSASRTIHRAVLSRCASVSRTRADVVTTRATEEGSFKTRPLVASFVDLRNSGGQLLKRGGTRAQVWRGGRPEFGRSWPTRARFWTPVRFGAEGPIFHVERCRSGLRRIGAS